MKEPSPLLRIGRLGVGALPAVRKLDRHRPHGAVGQLHERRASQSLKVSLRKSVAGMWEVSGEGVGFIAHALSIAESHWIHWTGRQAAPRAKSERVT